MLLPFPLWPQLTPFTNDNSALAGAAPQTVWISPTAAQGQKIGFAQQSSSFSVGLGIVSDFVITLAVFSDNAVDARIQAFNTLGVVIPVQLTASNLNVLLTDGENSDPSSQNVVTPPYNWQNVLYYTINATLPASTLAALGVMFIISFDILNYLTNGDTNPAGIAFVADIYGDLPSVVIGG